MGTTENTVPCRGKPTVAPFEIYVLQDSPVRSDWVAPGRGVVWRDWRDAIDQMRPTAMFALCVCFVCLLVCLIEWLVGCLIGLFVCLLFFVLFCVFG